MRTRGVLLLGTTALLAAACSQPEPQFFSEAPSLASSAATGPSVSVDPKEQPGRFVARCATEAEGNGTPGATIFTDGSEGVTDHCLRRYYIGVQPAPGSVYVPDDQAGFHAPTRSTEGVGNSTWTPAQPRTDLGGTPTPGPVAENTTDRPHHEGPDGITGQSLPNQSIPPGQSGTATTTPGPGGTSGTGPSMPGGAPQPSNNSTPPADTGSGNTGHIPLTPTPVPGHAPGSGSGTGLNSLPGSSGTTPSIVIPTVTETPTSYSTQFSQATSVTSTSALTPETVAQHEPAPPAVIDPAR